MNVPKKVAKCKSGEAARKQSLTEAEENWNLPVMEALCKNPVAKVLVENMDRQSCLSIIMVSKALNATYHPLVKKYLYYKANVGKMTEKEVRAQMPIVNIRVNNLRIYEGNKLDKVRPFFEVMGENMKKLLVTPKGYWLDVENLWSVLRLAPKLEHLELHVDGLKSGGELASCQFGVPNLEHVHTICLKYLGLWGLWDPESIKAFVDLLLICPRLKQIMFFSHRTFPFLGSREFLIRYAYLRIGLVIDYENITNDDYFVYFPVTRDPSFAIQNFGEELYLGRWLDRSSTRKHKEFLDVREWDKIGVTRPPNFVAALCGSDKKKCVESGFQFADSNSPTHVLDGGWYEDSSGDESEEDDDYEEYEDVDEEEFEEEEYEEEVDEEQDEEQDDEQDEVVDGDVAVKEEEEVTQNNESEFHGASDSIKVVDCDKNKALINQEDSKRVKDDKSDEVEYEDLTERQEKFFRSSFGFKSKNFEEEELDSYDTSDSDENNKAGKRKKRNKNRRHSDDKDLGKRVKLTICEMQ